MTNYLKAAASTGLVLLLGLTASAQSGKQGDPSGNQKVEKSDSLKSEKLDGKKGEQSNSQQEDAQDRKGSGRVETIRGELAAVSVVGETMVNYNTGRGVVAEFSYLTILGSPAAGKGGQADSKGGNASGSEKKDRDQAGKDQGRANDSSAGRRNVYEIAIGPDTQVRNRGSQGEKGSSAKQEGAARDKSLSALAQLELGDRVEVEFDRLTDQGQAVAGGEAQGGSASQARHGRHRIIRGVAKTLTILPSSKGGDHREGSHGKKSGDSSEKEKSGTDSTDKKSDREK